MYSEFTQNDRMKQTESLMGILNHTTWKDRAETDSYQGTKYQVLPNFGTCCRELEGTQSYEFSRMRAQFLLCHMVNISSWLLLKK